MLKLDQIRIWFSLEKMKRPEESVLCSEFNGHEIRSDMTEDEIYESVTGKNKKEYDLYIEELNREHEAISKELEKESKDLKDRIDSWIRENYGNRENYLNHIAEGIARKGIGFVENGLEEEWTDFVKRNIESSGILMDIVNCMEAIFKSGEDEARNIFNKQMHSGTTASIVLGTIDHFCGDKGKNFHKTISH